MDIKHLAKLAKLPLNDAEEKKYSQSLDSIIELVSKLKSISTENVLPTSQVTGQVNVFRDDEIDTSRVLTQEEALSNAKKTKNGYFVVPKILE